jgi:hypothetical protein
MQPTHTVTQDGQYKGLKVTLGAPIKDSDFRYIRFQDGTSFVFRNTELKPINPVSEK